MDTLGLVPTSGINEIANCRPACFQPEQFRHQPHHCSGNSVVDFISGRAKVELISWTPGSLLNLSKKNFSCPCAQRLDAQRNEQELWNTRFDAIEGGA
jgi:hypothetical protein